MQRNGPCSRGHSRWRQRCGDQAPRRGGAAPWTCRVVPPGRTSCDTGGQGGCAGKEADQDPRARGRDGQEWTRGREGSKGKGQLVAVGTEARARQAVHAGFSLFVGPSAEVAPDTLEAAGFFQFLRSLDPAPENTPGAVALCGGVSTGDHSWGHLLGTVTPLAPSSVALGWGPVSARPSTSHRW